MHVLVPCALYLQPKNMNNALLEKMPKNWAGVSPPIWAMPERNHFFTGNCLWVWSSWQFASSCILFLPAPPVSTSPMLYKVHWTGTKDSCPLGCCIFRQLPLPATSLVSCWELFSASFPLYKNSFCVPLEPVLLYKVAWTWVTCIFPLSAAITASKRHCNVLSRSPPPPPPPSSSSSSHHYHRLHHNHHHYQSAITAPK